jgi:hypothetical protein
MTNIMSKAGIYGGGSTFWPFRPFVYGHNVNKWTFCRHKQRIVNIKSGFLKITQSLDSQKIGHYVPKKDIMSLFWHKFE